MVQARWELSRAHEAARTLAERLELAGRRREYEVVRSIERSLWTDLLEAERPIQDPPDIEAPR